MTEAERTLVLDARQVKQKIKRMAFQIYERHFREKEIVLAGIDGQGYILATQLAKSLQEITATEIRLVKISLDKSAPQDSEIGIDCELKEIKKRCIVLVDDVLNTGKTFTYAMVPFLSIEVKRIEVAVLVNRNHRTFPVFPQYTGYELATTIKDHIEVKLGRESAVYLH